VRGVFGLDGLPEVGEFLWTGLMDFRPSAEHGVRIEETRISVGK
jgi:hypothetical protein